MPFLVVSPHAKFKASVYILKKEEGGRHTPFSMDIGRNYIRTTDVTGVVTLQEGTEMVMPGDNVEFEVSLITSIAMDKELGLQFVRVAILLVLVL